MAARDRAARALVVFYSRSGGTRRVAEAIAAGLGADLEEIGDATDRGGVLGYLRCAAEALLGASTEIDRPAKDPASYDVDGKLLVGFGANGDRYENWLTPAKPSRESLTPSALATELGNKGYPPNVPIQRKEKEAGYFIRGQAVGQEQAVHTAADVPIQAYAKNFFAWLPFVGVYENTDVFFKIAQVMEK